MKIKKYDLESMVTSNAPHNRVSVPLALPYDALPHKIALNLRQRPPNLPETLIDLIVVHPIDHLHQLPRQVNLLLLPRDLRLYRRVYLND